MKPKRKFLNFRYLPFMLLTAIVGILLISLLDFAYTLVVAVFFLIAIILTLCFAKLKKFRVRMIVLFLTFVVFVLVGGEYVSNAKQFRMPIYDATITGVINSDSEMTGESTTNSNVLLYNLILTDCEYASDNEKGKLDGIVSTYIYLSKDTDFKVGDHITIKADIIPKTVKLTESVNVYNYVEGIRWTLDNPSFIEVYAGKLTFFESIKVNTKDALTKYVPAGEIMYSMIFGNTKVMSSEFNKASKATGLAHLFAVSGLHLGLVSSIVGFVCKKCKANKFVDYIVVLILSGIYALLVGFGPSVVRAFLMLTIYKTGKLFGVRHCSLSALSLSALIILIVNPLLLFNLSFQLSVMSIVGIIFFRKPLNRLMRKIKWKKLRSFISINLSVNIALLPIMLNCFGRVSLLFMFSNLLVVPLVTLIFPFIFIVVLLSAVYAPLAYILVPFGFVFSIIEIFVVALANLPFLSINLSLSIFWVIMYLAFMVVISNFSLLPKKPKSILAIVLCLVIFTNVALTSFGRIDSSVKLETITSKNNTDIVMLDVGREHYLFVTGTLSMSTLSICSSYMAEKNIDKIDGFVKNDISADEINILYNYKAKLGINSLITSDKTPVLEYIFDDKVLKSKIIGDYNIELAKNLVILSNDKHNIVFVSGECDKNELPNKVDVLYCPENFDIAYVAKPKYYVNNNAVINNIPQSVNSYFTFIIKSDKIKVI